MALKLFGVTVSDATLAQVSVAGVETVSVRDLAAICGEVPYRPPQADEAAVRQHHEVVGAYHVAGPVLPAPVGVVFRTRDSVARWLELHYRTLSEALTFVENRVAARVHVSNNGGEEREGASDLVAAGTESLKALRRSAVATLPLRVEKDSAILLTAAFLIEHDFWTDFVAEVEAQGRASPALRFELTGPWPPFDFVQMQLGA